MPIGVPPPDPVTLPWLFPPRDAEAFIYHGGQVVTAAAARVDFRSFSSPPRRFLRLYAWSVFTTDGGFNLPANRWGLDGVPDPGLCNGVMIPNLQNMVTEWPIYLVLPPSTRVTPFVFNSIAGANANCRLSGWLFDWYGA